jgi:hypothetical protein
MNIVFYFALGCEVIQAPASVACMGGVIWALHATTQRWPGGCMILGNGSGGMWYLWNERMWKNAAFNRQGGWGSLEFLLGVLECLVGNAILIK